MSLFPVSSSGDAMLTNREMTAVDINHSRRKTCHPRNFDRSNAGHTIPREDPIEAIR